MSDPEHHEHQAQTGDAEGTLPPINVAVLFPSLGAPCIVERGSAEWVEVLLATADRDLMAVGNIAHYLFWRRFAELPDSRANRGGPPRPRVVPDPERLQWIHPRDIFITEQPWPLADLTRGELDETDFTTEDLDGAPTAPSPPSSAAPLAENPVHKGRDGETVRLERPIFPITTCRLHAYVSTVLKRSHPDVFRVLVRASVFPADAAVELVWTSDTPRAAYLAALREYAGSSGARGARLSDAAYDELEMRHPVIVRSQPMRRFAHFTDIHNSAAHNLLALSTARILDDSDSDPAYSPPVGSRMNNYNHAFSRLCEQAEALVDAFVLTGDLVDYGRGLWYPNSGGGPERSADWLPTMLAAGQDGFPSGIDPRADLPHGMPTPLDIWDQMGGHEQLQYVTDANMKYFVEHKLLPRYLAGKPVFTAMGNHDFHPHPFTPWPTSSGRPDETSYNPLTPSDYNLTRYEALLAYGPNSFDAYKSSAIWFTLLGFEGGGAGVVSTPRCGGLYYCFVNPWVDFATRLGDRSLFLFDFGRLEVRPQGITRDVFKVGALIAGLGLLFALGGLALLLWGPDCLASKIVGGILLALGLIAMIVGGIMMGATAGAGALMPDFEDTDLLPAAQKALSAAQVALVDAWAGLPGVTGRALFGHALVAGRPPRFVSIDQLNAHPEAATVDKMRYGILADHRDRVVELLRNRKLTVATSGHSHYTTLYRLADDGRQTTAEWPPTPGNGVPGDRAINVTRAAGPMAEINRHQADPLDGIKSSATERHVRGAPGGSVVTLDGAHATVEQLECDLATARPRRAAFDSWKNRLDVLKTLPVDGGPTVGLVLHYVSDVVGATGTRPPPQWPHQIAGLSIFLTGRRVRAALVLESGDMPTEAAASQPGCSAYRYSASITASEWADIDAARRNGQAIRGAIEYPESDEDPWIFDVSIERSGTDIEPVFTFQRHEFPDFDRRRQHFERFGARPT